MRVVLLWWFALLLTGIAFFPLAHKIFRCFEDRGWLFAKTIGLFFSAWLLFALNCTGKVAFTQGNILAVMAFLTIANYGLYAVKHYRNTVIPRRAGLEPAEEDLSDGLKAAWKMVLAEELLLFLLIALSVYVIGFKPEAYGTEKFMDYAFLTSMMRSLRMPFADPWFAGEAVNYYYGGQYMAAFLTKLTQVTAGEGYNLMRATVTAFSFMLPFSLVFQLTHDRLGRTGRSPAAFLSGLLGGTAVAFCGNFHYVIYGIILPIVNRAKGLSYSYWFPDSTRYIGYDPDLPDKTIHEFPAYSSVLGDLHAHYLNILFVVTVTAVVYAWAKKQDPRRPAKWPFLKTEVLLAGFMTGAFRWTNYWDFPIYYVVCGSIFFFVLLRIYRDEILKFVLIMLGIAAVMFAAGYVAALPFTVSFEKISSEVGRTHSFSQPYQLLILWGLPAVILIGYIISLILSHREMKRMTPRVLWKVRKMPLPDLAVLMYGLCAAGLVFLPEVIYVKDIYSGEHYRANTMFKLTYQAFILFGMCMAYILVRAVVLGARKRAGIPDRAVRRHETPDEAGEPEIPAGSGEPEQPEEHEEPVEEIFDEELPEGNWRHGFADDDRSMAQEIGEPAKQRGGTVSLVLGSVGIALLLLTAGYTGKSVSDWFGNIFDPSMRIHTDASVFVSESFPSDFEAINWLNSNVSGQPAILEAPGDSYSDYERVSVATGLPTVLGWRVHEWLWRENLDAVDERAADCETMYTSTDKAEVRRLLTKYGVQYVYIGVLEREKYPDLNDKLLQSLGKVVYSNGVDTYILEVAG